MGHLECLHNTSQDYSETHNYALAPLMLSAGFLGHYTHRLSCMIRRDFVGGLFKLRDVQ